MDLYQQTILDHYKRPHCQGELAGATHIGGADNLSCGDAVKFYLRVENNKIADIGWTGDGCVLSLATASMLAESLIGKSTAAAQKITPQNIINLLGVTPSPNRLKCALLPLDAIKKALE